MSYSAVEAAASDVAALAVVVAPESAAVAASKILEELEGCIRFVGMYWE